MIECTLQEAVKRCKETGGTMRPKDAEWAPALYWNDGYFAKAGTSDGICFDVQVASGVWIYEPPKQSAFQEWCTNEQYGKPSESLFRRLKKEGWNAAIDTISKTQTLKPGLCLLTADELLEQIKELKEI